MRRVSTAVHHGNWRQPAHAGKGWVVIQLLEKDLLEKVSVGLQGTECGFCKWGLWSSSRGDRSRQGRGWAQAGFFPGESLGHSAEVPWEEGQRGC